MKGLQTGSLRRWKRDIYAECALAVSCLLLTCYESCPMESASQGPSSKSTVEEIRERFDNDVERFSNLETGQTATVDAALAMNLVAQTASRVTPQGKRLLDIGCGAGNYTLALLQQLPGLDVTLLDLSQPMLDRAEQRVREAGASSVKTVQGDIRELPVEPNSCDIILAAAVLHHLRTPAEWQQVFANLYEMLTPGGAIWIFDLVESSNPAVNEVMWERYGQYLTAFKGEDYRDHVFAYIAQEDSPQSLMYQLQLLQRVGFSHVDVLHKNSCFAAFGAVK